MAETASSSNRRMARQPTADDLFRVVSHWPFCTFLTFTIDPKRYGCPCEVLQEIRLLRIGSVFKELNRQGRLASQSWVAVLEWNAELLWPHVHCLCALKFIPPRRLQPVLRGVWPFGRSNVSVFQSGNSDAANRARDEWERFHQTIYPQSWQAWAWIMCGYIAKDITKPIPDSAKGCGFQVRRYHTSRGFLIF